MSIKFIVFTVLFSLALSMMISQEASALTNWSGQYTRTTTASLGPSKVCGDHICRSGESSKWSHAVMASQRQGPTKATGGYNGMVIMHQLVVNSVIKPTQVNSAMTPSHEMGKMSSPQVNMTSSK
ncbi:MAG: hypothetical protein P4K92_01115 [Candidatus Nitrosotalea sp.]|nr:hypothetical protein [Candidatus Nitrosotalea sp.]